MKNVLEVKAKSTDAAIAMIRQVSSESFLRDDEHSKCGREFFEADNGLFYCIGLDEYDHSPFVTFGRTSEDFAIRFVIDAEIGVDTLDNEQTTDFRGKLGLKIPTENAPALFVNEVRFGTFGLSCSFTGRKNIKVHYYIDGNEVKPADAERIYRHRRDNAIANTVEGKIQNITWEIADCKRHISQWLCRINDNKGREGAEFAVAHYENLISEEQIALRDAEKKLAQYIADYPQVAAVDAEIANANIEADDSKSAANLQAQLLSILAKIRDTKENQIYDGLHFKTIREQYEWLISKLRRVHAERVKLINYRARCRKPEVAAKYDAEISMLFDQINQLEGEFNYLQSNVFPVIPAACYVTLVVASNDGEAMSELGNLIEDINQRNLNRKIKNYYFESESAETIEDFGVISDIDYSKYWIVEEYHGDFSKADYRALVGLLEDNSGKIEYRIDVDEYKQAEEKIDEPPIETDTVMLKAEVEIDGSPRLNKVSRVKNLSSAIDNLARNIFSNFGKLVFKAKITNSDMPLVELHASDRDWFFANDDYKNIFNDTVKSWLEKHTEEVSAQIQLSKPSAIQEWLWRIAIDDGGFLLNCLADNYLRRYDNFNDLVKALIFTKQDGYCWVVDVRRSLDFAFIVDNLKGANGEIQKAVRNAIVAELIASCPPDETVDNNDDPDEDVDEKAIAPITALEVYSPVVEVQTADEVAAERFEKLQQLNSRIDATSEANLANLAVISDAIDFAELDGELTDDLSDAYFDVETVAYSEAFNVQIGNATAFTIGEKINAINAVAAAGNDVLLQYFQAIQRASLSFEKTVRRLQNHFIWLSGKIERYALDFVKRIPPPKIFRTITFTCARVEAAMSRSARVNGNVSISGVPP